MAKMPMEYDSGGVDISSDFTAKNSAVISHARLVDNTVFLRIQVPASTTSNTLVAQTSKWYPKVGTVGMCTRIGLVRGLVNAETTGDFTYTCDSVYSNFSVADLVYPIA